MSKYLFDEKEDWTFEKLDRVYEEIEKIALGEMKLEVFPNQIEIIDSEKMLDAYSSVGMPIYYRHWSLGKSFIGNQKSYQAGRQSLAYEIVLNCNPCISYLQESNDMTMQALVLAHAAFGHNAVFKNNCEFIRWTSPDSILDELNFAKVYIAKCEERYGEKEVEAVLDACHSLMDFGVDTHKRPSKSRAEMGKRASEAFDRKLEDYDLVWEKTVYSKKKEEELPEGILPNGSLQTPEENILYFIEKNAPNLPQWKREIIRIVRKVAQYFYPQGLTKVLNEGFATYTHHRIMNRLYEKKLISEGAWFGFIQSHTNVVMQPDFDDPRYGGLNPYSLGFNIFRDIERMCLNPTDEDRLAMPHVAGKDLTETLREAVSGYNDSGFISQFMSPKVMRDMKLFALRDAPGSQEYKVEAIHNDSGYEKLRALLSEKHTRGCRTPQIVVKAADLSGDRKLTLEYIPYRNRPLDAESAKSVLAYAQSLWGYPVELKGL